MMQTDTFSVEERFGRVERRKGGQYVWVCPECGAQYSDGWGGRDTTIRRRQHIGVHLEMDARASR